MDNVLSWDEQCPDTTAWPVDSEASDSWAVLSVDNTAWGEEIITDIPIERCA